LAERVLGKDEVTSSILVIGSILRLPLNETASFGWQASEGFDENGWTASGTERAGEAASE
jgi:hypothetical protein